MIYMTTYALAAPAVIAWRPPLSGADKAIHAFIVEISRGGTDDEVIFITKPWEWEDARARLMALSAGGFVYIQGRLDETSEWFRSHGWQSLPFTWRTYYIWRKPVERSA